MADKKQIMINGVDVSECEYLTYQLEEDGQYYWFCKISPTGGPDECEYNPECFYKRVLKQLARKTQECEELKEEIQQLGMQFCNDCGEKDDYNIPCKMIRDLDYGLQKEIEENDRYRKALEEIEVAIATYSRKQQYSIANDLYNQILDIINKAKGEGK